MDLAAKRCLEVSSVGPGWGAGLDEQVSRWGSVKMTTIPGSWRPDLNVGITPGLNVGLRPVGVRDTPVANVGHTRSERGTHPAGRGDTPGWEGGHAWGGGVG